MTSLLAQCTQCKTQFSLPDQALKFYKRMGLSLPTHCPECRVKRRMMWRNDRIFYRRNCSKTGQSFISMYPEGAPYPVYKPDVWWSEQWDPMDYGQAFDFNRSFFEQFNELMQKVPRLGIDIVNCQNSDFCNFCGDDKNCYLDIAGEANEDCYFNLFTKYSKNCADCTFAYHSELLYECINAYNSYDCQYSMHIETCSNCYFSFDLKGCKNCLFCNNLRQKEYYIFNKPHTKEEYLEKLKTLKLGTYSGMLAARERWVSARKKAIHRDMYTTNVENCTGNDIKNSKNCEQVFNVLNCEDCKYLYDVLDAKDCYDLNYSLYKPEMACELISTLAMRYSACCMASHYCNNVYYCDQCNNSSFLFGCIGLNRKQYCIFNKQYLKEEYEKLLPQVIEYMKKTGEWGEFFPASISPFAYNETVVQEYFPIDKETALKEGYRWKDSDARQFQPQKHEIQDDIADVPDSVTKETLDCVQCQKNFRLITQELSFYRKQNLPIPRKCPDCRHQDRMSLRTPRQLWPRPCAKCNAPIQTTYAPGRPEIVYCEKCYLKEVY